MPGEQSHAGHGFADEITLAGDEANVYEAIATLEYLGQPAGSTELVAATGLSVARAGESLDALTGRGVLVTREDDDRTIYEPAYRGWSTSPDQATGPQR